MKRSAYNRCLIFLAVFNILVAQSSLLFNYVYDGHTTYCYWLKQGLQVENPDTSYIYKAGRNEECPITLTIRQSVPDPVPSYEDIKYDFTATLNTNNKFNVTELYTTLDPFTGVPAEIAHANIHVCSHATVCDMFRPGADKHVSTQETSNFTDGQTTFHQSVSYEREGKYSVMAHIILPAYEIESERYDIFVYTTTTVASRNDTNNGLSTGATVGIAFSVLILCVCLSLVFVMLRRRRNRNMIKRDQFNDGTTASSLRKGKPSLTTTTSGTKLGFSGENSDYPWAGSNFKSGGAAEQGPNFKQYAEHSHLSAPGAPGRQPYYLTPNGYEDYTKPFVMSTGTLHLGNRSSAQTSGYNPFLDSSTDGFNSTQSFGHYDMSMGVDGAPNFAAPPPEILFPSYPGKVTNNGIGAAGLQPMETLDEHRKLDLSMSILENPTKNNRDSQKDSAVFPSEQAEKTEKSAGHNSEKDSKKGDVAHGSSTYEF